MTIQKRHVGFHPPITLPGDAINYCDGVEKIQKPPASGHGGHHGAASPAVIIPGNDAEKLARIRLLANELAPIAQRIRDAEAEISDLYNRYDRQAVGLWNELTEARDYAETYAEKHDAADVRSIVNNVRYHAGRAVRHDLAAIGNGPEAVSAQPSGKKA